MSLACVPALRKTKGSVINFSSTFSERATPEFSRLLRTKGLRFDRAYRINVNAVSPGLVRSEIYFNEATSTSMGKSYPLGRAGEPADARARFGFSRIEILASSRSTMVAYAAR